MPYNTRRKSLSLSELGITLPKRARAPSHPTLPLTTTTEEEPPTKKSRLSAGPESPQPSSNAMSPPASTNIRIKTEAPKPSPIGVEHTPPPSPGAVGVSKIDTEGINDTIVVGVIQQLEKTGNRPHLVKELAAILATFIPAIERSANPCALISSRVTSYLNRTWPTVSPCPLAKVQTDVHPRRLYFYLTTCPRQPFPEPTPIVPISRRVISPSISSASAAEEEAEEKYLRQRTALSPSPEVDLSSPELDDDTDGGSSFTGRNSLPRDHPPTSSNLQHNRRADSPPLEREERDFKQTATALQQQRRSSQQEMKEGNAMSDVAVATTDVAMSVENDDESSERAIQRNSEAVAMLFEDHPHLSMSLPSAYDFSSPMLKPQNGVHVEIKNTSMSLPAFGWHGKRDTDAMSVDSRHDPMDDTMDHWTAWDGELMSPENVELDELEDLFDAY